MTAPKVFAPLLVDSEGRLILVHLNFFENNLLFRIEIGLAKRRTQNIGEKFDGVRPTNLRVPVEAMKNALETLDPEVRAAIEESVHRARAVAKSQVPHDFHTDLADGARVAERWIPIQRVGLYVPGGKAVYPSSVIMNTVPAQAAGVESLAIATPPSKGDPDGLPNKTILATCAILGVEEVYAVGGAQAIAMFAYGAKGSEPQDGEILCDPVDKITGPGNIFVATAKSLVSGFVGIDAVAGPTEIGIIADKTANPSLLAADLIGQAEHDELAGSVLFRREGSGEPELPRAPHRACGTRAHQPVRHPVRHCADRRP